VRGVIDLDGLPKPRNAPAPGTCIRYERPADGLLRLVLDPPHRPKLAVFDRCLLFDLDLALEEVAQESGLCGLIVTGRTPLSFAGGADVEGIAEVTDAQVAARFVRAGQELFQRLHRLSREGGGKLLTVAAVGGPVPGGACEIALACDRIVLADDPRTRIGLPEVRLGILPAWGGSQRLPRRVGVPVALELILNGTLVSARKALQLGLVDRLAKPDVLLRVAEAVASGKERLARKRRGALASIFVDHDPLAALLIAAQARRTVLRQTHGHYPAPLAVLPLVTRAPRIALEEGLRAEREAVAPLAVSPITKNLASLFLLSEEAKRLGEPTDGGTMEAADRVAVLGAGVMGAGIASLCAMSGIAVRLLDVEPKALDAAVIAHRAEVEKQLARRRLERHAADAARDRLEATTTWDGFQRCRVVIEAVAERLEVKRTVLGELARRVAPDAILATNTSSIAVDAIAEGLPYPERVVGLHFFNPVARMPLVEIVRARATTEEVVARTARLAIDLGKTPVVVRDVPGFLVNRVLGPYLDEALRLVEGGVEPAKIDAALIGFGMPMGPCELLDEVGLDIASHAGASLEAAYGERMKATKWLKPLVDAGQLGKKSGAGIYRWSRGKVGRLRRDGLNPRLPARVRGGAALDLGDEDLVDRLVLAMVNEAVRCLEESVVASARVLDLATVFGTGFAPFRGGVLRYADARGLSAIVERLRRIHEASGLAGAGERRARFEPAERLVRMARDGARFHP
jgi:3-hydroxyacyl-CoA dehydrogenase/enoyl-CoA hydratase/3-hydroxybutyryl-CoA epimerase